VHYWSDYGAPFKTASGYVCMYVGTYVHTYVCMYVCIIVCMYVCMYTYSMAKFAHAGVANWHMYML
jgi:hypothetical protein